MAMTRRRPPAPTTTVDRSHAGVKARAKAAGFKGTKAAVNKTFNKNQAHAKDVKVRSTMAKMKDLKTARTNGPSASAYEHANENASFKRDTTDTPGGRSAGPNTSTPMPHTPTRPPTIKPPAKPAPELTFAAVAARALAAGRHPTEAQIRATLAASKARAAARK